LSNGGRPGHAVHSFAGVIERALRESIFIPFREEAGRNPALGDISEAAEDAKLFCNFLNGKADPTLGQMLTITSKSRKSSQSPFQAFAKWLQDKHPRYYERIGQLHEHKMIEFRNREDHLKRDAITRADADKMLDATKEMINLIFEAQSRVSSI
jgi:hypothetical protein